MPTGSLAIKPKVNLPAENLETQPVDVMALSHSLVGDSLPLPTPDTVPSSALREDYQNKGLPPTEMLPGQAPVENST